MLLREVRIGRRAFRVPRPRQRLFNYYYFMYKKQEATEATEATEETEEEEAALYFLPRDTATVFDFMYY